MIFARSAICYHFNCPPESIVIERDNRGKPYCIALEHFTKKKQIQFNVSHSGRWIVCAVAEVALGIDIQQILHLSASRQDLLSRKILTAEEQREYVSLPEFDRPEFLCGRFCMKESCIKASGIGMRIPFNTIFLKDEGDHYSWENRTDLFFVREYFLDPEYKLFLCSTESSVAEMLKS